MSKKEINVVFKSKKQKIKYYGSLDEDQLKKKIKHIFKIKETLAQIDFRDEEGDIILINSQIPSGLSIHVFIEPDIPENFPKELKLIEKKDLLSEDKFTNKESLTQKNIIMDPNKTENDIESKDISINNSEGKGDNKSMDDNNNNEIISLISCSKKKETFCHICHKQGHKEKECYFNKKNQGRYNKKYTGGKRFRDMKDKSENENNMGATIKNDDLVKSEDVWSNDKKETNWNIKTDDNWGNNNINNERWN